MSLQGTLDTLSVTELFGLLSTAGKTGALRLEAGEHAASIFVAAGQCRAVESGDLPELPESDGELADHLVDVGFSLARQASGSFRFNDGDAPAGPAAFTTSLDAAAAEITSMLEQWKEIEATIPSLDARVRLAPVLRSDEIVLSADEWKLLVVLDGMPSVREIVAMRREPLINVGRLLKTLAERGAIEVGVDLGRPASVVTPARPVPDIPAAETAGEGESEGWRRRVGARGRSAEGESPAPAAEPSPALAVAASPTPAVESDDRGVHSSEPFPDVDAPGGVAAVAAAADAIAAAEADAMAAGASVRPIRARPSSPDDFATDNLAPDAAADLDAELVPQDAAAAGSGEGTPDRGALLRLFSALKEN